MADMCPQRAAAPAGARRRGIEPSARLSGVLPQSLEWPRTDTNGFDPWSSFICFWGLGFLRGSIRVSTSTYLRVFSLAS